MVAIFLNIFGKKLRILNGFKKHFLFKSKVKEYLVKTIFRRSFNVQWDKVVLFVTLETELTTFTKEDNLALHIGHLCLYTKGHLTLSLTNTLIAQINNALILSGVSLLQDLIAFLLLIGDDFIGLTTFRGPILGLKF